MGLTVRRGREAPRPVVPLSVGTGPVPPSLAQRPPVGGLESGGLGGSAHEVPERPAPPPPALWGQPRCTTPRLLSPAGLESVQGAQVPHDEAAGDEDEQGREAHEPAPTSGDIVAGRVLYRRVAALYSRPPGIRLAPGGRGVVVFLSRFGVDLGRDGEGLLGAARRRALGQGQDAWALVGQGHGRRAGWAAQFPRARRAGDAVVAVLVVGRYAGELVVGQFFGLLVMASHIFGTGVAPQGPRPNNAGGTAGQYKLPLPHMAPRKCPVARGRPGAGPSPASPPWLAAAVPMVRHPVGIA